MMGVRQQNITIRMREIFYGLFFLLMLFAKGIGLYDGQIQYKLFFVAAFFFFICKMVSTPYSRKEFLAVLLIGCVSSAAFYISDEKGILICAAVVVGMKGISVNRIMKWSFYVWSISFAGITVLSQFRLHETLYKVHDKLGLGHIFRWSLGYPHPNVLHISFLIFLVFYLYVRKERFEIKTFIWMFIINIFVFLYSVSYTGFAIVVFYLAGNLYWTYRGKLGKIEQILVQMVLPACLVLSLAGPIVLKGRLFDIINKILNTRLSLSREFLIPENISLFGVDVVSITNQWKTMDNSYVYTLIAYGIIPFVMICIGYIFMINHMVKKQQGKELLIVIALLAAGLTEPFLFNTSFKNPVLLFLGGYLFERLGGGKEKIRLLDFIGRREIIFGTESGICRKIMHIRLNWLESVRLHGKKIVVLALAGAAAAAIIFQFTAVFPEYVVVPRKVCADVSEESALYMEQKAIDALEDTLVLGYENNTVPMQKFSGNIIKVEKFRGSFACAGIAAGVIFLLISVAYMRKEQQYNE